MILVVETLPNSAGTVGLKAIDDPVMEGRDQGKDGWLLLAGSIIGEIGANEVVPFGGGTLRLAGLIAGSLGNGDQLGNSVTADAQALSDLASAAAGVPVFEYFDDIAHGETPSCHLATP